MVLGSISPTFTRTFNFRFRLGLVLVIFGGWFKCLFLSEFFFGTLCSQSILIKFLKGSHGVLLTSQWVTKFLKTSTNIFSIIILKKHIGTNQPKQWFPTHMGPILGFYATQGTTQGILQQICETIVVLHWRCNYILKFRAKT